MAAAYKIGSFRLDVEAGILFRGAEPVRLGRRAVQLLRVLAEQPRVPISKETLLQAAWPGLSVEESNLTVQIAALRRALGVEPGGERWIETLPRCGYRFVGPFDAENSQEVTVAPQRVVPGSPAGSVVAPTPILPHPHRPSIAVLPFQNMSDDPEQDYFADGMVEEITTALSRFRELFVIARNSTFTYKGRNIDAKQIGRELGVAYLVEGSVRKVGKRLRLTGQLIESANGMHLWAERFDGSLTDVFALQDRLTSSVVGSIVPRLSRAEVERAQRKPTASLDAYDYYMRGLASAHRLTREATEEAQELFAKASALDPDFASPYAMASYCYAVRKMYGWTTDRAHEVAEAARLARLAADRGKDDAVALAFAGLALHYVVRNLEGAAAIIDRALALNPNLAAAWYASGQVRASRGGEPDAAIEHLARAMHLSPLDPFMFSMQGMTAFAHFHAGRYAEAVEWAEKALWQRPDTVVTLRIAAVSYAFAGRLEEARKAVARALELDPDIRISNLKERVGAFGRAEDYAKYVEGLRKAGLPE